MMEAGWKVYDKRTGKENALLSAFFEDWPYGYPALVMDWIIQAYMLDAFSTAN